MSELLQKIPDVIELIALFGMAVSILATLIVRVIPGTKDDEAVNKFIGFFLKGLKWLPTIGVNPQTKKLEEAYAELKAKVEAEGIAQKEAPPSG
jgi:hypothetical protein